MAVNVVGQPNERAQFLALVMPLNNAHTAVTETIRSSRLLRDHRQLTLGDPANLRVLPGPIIDQALNDALRVAFRELVAATGDPRTGPEARTSACFQAMLYTVNAAVRRQQPPVHLGVAHALPLQVVGPGIDIGGWCDFELKRFVQGNRRLFYHGRDQALLYAAAIGHAGNHPMRAIVTDLNRWQFFEVDDGGYTQSREYLMGFTHRGTPRLPAARTIVRRLLRFLTP